MVVGHHDEGAWRKALAVADALTQTTASVLVVADADVWCDGLLEAIAHVANGGAWAMPHRGVLRLSERATSALLTTGEADLTDSAQPGYLGVEGGGAVALRRDVYERCPLDPRFAGWGSEDEAWGFALGTLHGPSYRVKAPLLHLWHPPAERATRSRGSRESWDLRKRYAKAIGNPTTTRALIEEGRAHDLDRALEPVVDDRSSLAGLD